MQNMIAKIFFSSENKFIKNDKLNEIYVDMTQVYITLGHMKLVEREYAIDTVDLPHHAL